MLTPDQARRYLHVSDRTMYAMLRTGRIEAERVGGLWHIPKRSFLERFGARLPETERNALDVTAHHNTVEPDVADALPAPEHCESKDRIVHSPQHALDDARRETIGMSTAPQTTATRPLSLRRAAAYLAMGTRRLARLTSQGRIKHKYENGRYYFMIAWLDEYRDTPDPHVDPGDEVA